MTRPPRDRTSSIAAGSTFTSVPRETVPSAGAEVCTSTTSGGSAVASRTGTSDSRQGKYLSCSRPRIPAPTKGVSSVTPARSGTPAWAFSMNSRYSATVSSRIRNVRHGVPWLPAATTLGRPGSVSSTAASLVSETIRTVPSFQARRWAGYRRMIIR